MPQLLSLSRAARLVGVTRGSLQKKLKDGEIHSFDGMVDADELSRVFPGAQLEDTSELDRVTQIKDRAFGKRVFERALPDKEVLAARIKEIGQELARSKAHLAFYRGIVERLDVRLKEMAKGNGDSTMAEQLKEWLAQELEQGVGVVSDSLVGRDSYLRVMAAQVKLLPSNREFFVEGNDTVLEAALRAGVPLGYGCSSGNCGKCRAKVLSGKIKYVRPHDYVFTDAQKAQNYALLCACTAITDLAVEAVVAGGPADIPFQQISTKVKAMDTPRDDVMVLQLMAPRSNRLRFMSGQSAVVKLGGSFTAELPIASCPCEERLLQFHLRRLPGNLFSDYAFNRLKVGDAVEVEGPKGEFVLDDESTRSLVFIAWGAGFAPVKGLVEHAVSLEAAESLHLYWAAQSESDIYLPNQCRAWEDALDDFRYTPLVDSSLHGSSGPHWEKGLRRLLQPVQDDHPDLKELDFYVAGPQAHVEATRALLLDWGVPPEQLRVGCVG